MKPEELRNKYYELKNCRAVAEYYNTYPEAIRRQLINYGIDRTGWKHDDIIDKIIALFDQGKTIAAIGEEVGLRRGTVKDIIERYGTPIKKKCAICGKEFTTYLPHKKTCSDECKAENARRKKRERDHKRCTRQGRKGYDHTRYIKRKYGSEEGYREHIEEIETAKLARIREKDEEREKRKRLHLRHFVCVVCGKSFETYNPFQKTCCKSCSLKLRNAHSNHRIPPGQVVDKDITLKRLFLRDKGICYLCGGACDWNDKTDKCVGPMYPSIDHVIPIARGGLHAWDNVMLAHFRCNVNKSTDLLLDRLPLSEEEAYALKKVCNHQRKRVRQVSKSGEVLAEFESTVDAANATGFKSKQIQNCARGETKLYRGYVWEYI